MDHSLKNRSHLKKWVTLSKQELTAKWVRLSKMGYTWKIRQTEKKRSNLEKSVTLGKMGST